MPDPGARKTAAGVGSIPLPTKVPSDPQETRDSKQDIESNTGSRPKQGSDPDESGNSNRGTNPSSGSNHASNENHDSDMNQIGNSKGGCKSNQNIDHDQGSMPSPNW